jgi:hypothetical protein
MPEVDNKDAKMLIIGPAKISESPQKASVGIEDEINELKSIKQKLQKEFKD